MADANGHNTVLLIDDDEFLLDLYAHKFEANGFSVVKLPSAEEALKHLREGLSPEVIVFDIVMPRVDGYGFLEAMKNEKLAPRAVKIALSNQTQEADVERAKELGADGYIGKASAIPSETVDAVLNIVSDRRNQPAA